MTQGDANPTEWLSFDGSQPKKRRAELVCTVCHGKKIKCDLQVRKRSGESDCSNCATAGKPCHIRSSRRIKRKRPVNDCAPPSTAETARLPTPTTNTIDIMEMPGDIHYSPFGDMPTFDAIHVTNTCSSIRETLTAGVDRHDHYEPRRQSTTSLSRRPSNSLAAAAAPFAKTHPIPHMMTSPAQKSQASETRSESLAQSQSHTGDIDTGFLQVYGPENRYDAEKQTLEATLESKAGFPSLQQQDLEESFIDTYREYCYTWAPILDLDTLPEELSRSPLLANALATAACHIRPPLLPHDGPAAYYKRARTLFYDDEEPDGITSIKSIALFYWWAPRPPTVVHRHSSWWWTSVLIRHAQQINIHREPKPSQTTLTKHELSLRRRIWWTAFARERLTSLCQSKPAIIDPEDCTISEPTLDDFPPDPQSQHKGEIFIYWVRLTAIMGQIAKDLSRVGGALPPALLDHYRHQLAIWINSLPPHLQLPIGAPRTLHFDRDVHQLHLPYLTTIIILNLKRSAHTVPEALPPAILAGSCIVRIMRDILSRGNVRFLMAITCWYTGTAVLALLQATTIDHLAQDANEGLDVLCRTLDQLQTMWASANVIRQGFDRLRAAVASKPTATGTASSRPPPSAGAAAADTSQENNPPASRGSENEDHGDFDWTALFPFVTRDTSSIASSLLKNKQDGNETRGFPSPTNFLFHDELMMQYDNLFDSAAAADFGGLDFDQFMTQ